MFFRLKQVVFCVSAAVTLTAAAMPIPVLDESFHITAVFKVYRLANYLLQPLSTICEDEE